MIVGLSHRGSLFYVFIMVLISNNISDSKRQQTTTVDNKRLINGFFLTRFVILQQKISTVMEQFELVPEIQSELGHLTKMELRRYVLDYYKHYLKGKEVINKDTGITIHFSMTSGRKTAMGEAMYQKKAEMIRILPELVRYAIYNNFGKRKHDESEEIIGYLNFKGRCKIDGKTENLRIAIQFQRSAKFYYNIEVNMIK